LPLDWAAQRQGARQAVGGRPRRRQLLSTAKAVTAATKPTGVGWPERARCHRRRTAMPKGRPTTGVSSMVPYTAIIGQGGPPPRRRPR